MKDLIWIESIVKQQTKDFGLSWAVSSLCVSPANYNAKNTCMNANVS